MNNLSESATAAEPLVGDAAEAESPAKSAESAETVPQTPGDGSTGRLVWLVALLALLAALLARALAPALPGVWVGIDHIITAVKLAAALSSQLAAVCVSALVMALVVATVRRPVPVGLRVFTVGVGALVVLAVMISSATRLPQLSGMIVGLGAVLLAATLAVYNARLLGLRAAALVLLSVAVAGLFRLLATACSLWVIKGGAVAWGTVARALATLSMLALAVAVGLSLLWLLTQPARAGSRTLAGRAGTVALAVLAGFALMLLAQHGAGGEAKGVSLLIARVGARLTPHPIPYLPPLLRLTIECLAWTSAVAVLLRAPRTLLMSAAVASALICDAVVEMPLAAGLLVVGALALLHHPAVDLRDQLAGESAAQRREA